MSKNQLFINRRPLFSILGLLLFFLISYYSARNLMIETVTELDEGCRCRDSVNDPFDQPHRYSFGRYEGMCINSCKFRSAHTEPVTQRPGSLKVGNIFHKKAFWHTEINLHNVERAYFVFEEFRPNINHTAIRFQLRQPVLLKPQNAPNKKPFYVSSLLVSPEGIPARGTKYNFVDGILGNYTLVYRLITYESFVAYAESKKHKVLEYKLSGKHLNFKKLLTNSLKTSVSQSFKPVYQLLAKNCATTSLALLFAARQEGPAMADWSSEILNLAQGIPLSGEMGTLYSLKNYGFLDMSDRAVR